ncbi:MAG: hypothetical protein HQK75_03335, partial [Candidatus Magnetomorum sp.]|nr:hypothetical protein [Candidatus Magnetomorum sp.]
MKKQKKINGSSIFCYLLATLFICFTLATTAWAFSNPTQVVTALPSSGNAYTGQTITIDLLYSVSDEYTQLNGLGIMIHYDTNFFDFQSLQYTAPGTIGTPYIDDESVADNDGDENTNKTITLAWYDQNTEWPGEPLPVTLCSLLFLTDSDLSINDISIIRITPTSTHVGYAFYADPITLTIADPDQGPVVLQAISDITVDEDADSQTIDLSTVFSDSDNNDAMIVKSILSNSNPSLISASINENTLSFDFLADQYGSAEITIQAESNGKTISDTFTITVTAVDDPPYISQALSDDTADEDADNLIIDLSTVFSDIDNNDAAIVKTILSNSDSTLISASINGNSLTLDFLENQNGSAEITI